MTSVVLPAPVGPTIAIICPGAMSSDMSSMSGTSSLYLKLTSSNCTAPRGAAIAVRVVRIGRLFRLVEQLEHALGRHDRQLNHVGDAAQLRDRHRELPAVLDERLHVADRQSTGASRAAPPITATST